LIKLPGGKTISDVVISTALGVDGRGIFPHTLKPCYRNLLTAARQTSTTVITKSMTRHKRTGNFIQCNPFTWKYIQKLPSRSKCALLNAYELTNPGVEKCVKYLKKTDNSRIIPSLYPEFSKGEDMAIYEARVAVGILEDDLIGLISNNAIEAAELNLSCPNSKEVITKNMQNSLRCVKDLKKFFPELFIIAKISIVHPYEFAQELERIGIDAIHSVNTIPFEMVYPGKISPLAKVGGGGVSGSPIFWQAYDYNNGLRQKVKVPIIMGGGVTNSDYAIKYKGIGADAVSICTVALRNPKEARKIVELFNI